MLNEEGSMAGSNIRINLARGEGRPSVLGLGLRVFTLFRRLLD